MRVSPPSEGTHPASASFVPSTGTGRRDAVRAPREAPAIAVVVATLGRARLLQQCLTALVRLRTQRGQLEVIVVDDGPSLMTAHIVGTWVERFVQAGIGLTYLANEGARGPAAARNVGWRATRASLVAFTDDDTEPAEDWIEHGAAAFERGIDAAWGRIVMPIPPVPTDYELDANGLERAGFVTANCFCRRETLARLGGFDESFRLAWREDTDFYFRLLRSGARVAHVPQAVVVHPVRPAPWGVSLRQQRKVMFDALLYKKHPRLYRLRIRARPRLDYYAIVVLLLATLAAVVVGSTPALLLAGVPWVALTAWFCAERLARTSRSPSHVAEMIVTSALIPPVAVFWRLYGAVKFRTLFL